MNYRDVPMPPRIAALDRDHRGYPIPFIVFRDDDGTPNFVVNDTRKTYQAAREKLCSICGEVLDMHSWFLGGPSSAFANEVGAYIDGPMHHECMQYAAMVCPHLTHVMTRPVNMDPIKRKLEPQGVRLKDNTVIPGVPDIFVAVQAYMYTVVRVPDGTLMYHVARPYKKVEYWKEGQLQDRREGEREAKKAVRKLLKELESNSSS